MSNKRNGAKHKTALNKILELEADRETEEAFEDLNVNPNPIKRQIRIKQFPWTDKQKEFFKIALHPSTKIIFVNGPAGTSKTLLATYCRR